MLEADHDLPGQETRKWAMLCHLGGLASLVLFPTANIILPLVIWLTKRDTDPYVDEQGREAVNFQISMFLYGALVFGLVFMLEFILIGYLFFWLPFLVVIAQLGGTIVGAIRAHDGENFRYPLILRFL